MKNVSLCWVSELECSRLRYDTAARSDGDETKEKGWLKKHWASVKIDLICGAQRSVCSVDVV